MSHPINFRIRGNIYTLDQLKKGTGTQTAYEFCWTKNSNSTFEFRIFYEFRIFHVSMLLISSEETDLAISPDSLENISRLSRFSKNSTFFIFISLFFLIHYVFIYFPRVTNRHWIGQKNVCYESILGDSKNRKSSEGHTELLI